MRCANRDATEEAARVRATGKQENQDSAAGVSLPTAADGQYLTPNVACACGHPRADSSSTASAAGGSPMGVTPEYNLSVRASRIPLPTRSRPQSLAVRLYVRKRRLLCLGVVSIRLCAMKCSAHLKSLSTCRRDRTARARIHMM